MSQINFLNKASTICSVGVPGASLFPALAAAIVSQINSKQGIPEKIAGPLLKKYLQAYPKTQTTLSRLPALEQWKSMIRANGGAATVSAQLANVLKETVFSELEKKPEKYCFAIKGFVNFKENLGANEERAIQNPTLSIIASSVNCGITYRELDGPHSVPAKEVINPEATWGLSLYYDRTVGEYQPKLHQAERFKSMRCNGKFRNEAHEFNLKYITHKAKTTFDTTVNREIIMYKAGETTKDQLVTRYIEQLNKSGKVVQLTNGFNANEDIPSDVSLLITAIATQETAHTMTQKDRTELESDYKNIALS